jgi:hypothetical protein
MHLFHSGWRFARLQRLLLPALAVPYMVSGCRDATSPANAPIESIHATYTPDYSQETPDSIPLTVPSATSQGMLPGASSPSVSIQHPTVMEIEFYSSVTATPNTNPGPGAMDLGLSGEHCTNSSSAAISLGSDMGIWRACQTTPQMPKSAKQWVDTVKVRGNTGLSRAPHPGATTEWCGNSGQPPCYSWSASPATARMRPLAVQMKLRGLPNGSSTVTHLDERTVLLTGPHIEIEAFNAPATIKGLSTGLAVDWRSVVFHQEDGTVRYCNQWPDNVTYTRCVLWSVTKNGTLYMTGMANGKWRQSSLRVIVNTNFTLTATPTAAPVDETVQFVARVNGTEVPVARWEWRGGIDADSLVDCRAGEGTCEQRMRAAGSGTMTAYLADSSAASATVTVQDPICEPIHDDPLLNHPNVRAGLRILWELSNPDADRFWHRIERTMSVYEENGDTLVYIHPPGNNTACSASRQPSPGKPLATVHTHSARFGELVTCFDGDPKAGEYSNEFGGGSAGDWQDVTKHKDSVPSLVLDRDSIFVLLPGMPPPPNPSAWYWDKQLKEYAPLSTVWPNYYRKAGRLAGTCKRF